MKLWVFAQECEPSIDKIICDLTGTPVISKPQINHFVVYFKWTFWGSFVVKTPYLEALEFSCTMLYNHKYPSQKSQLNIGGNTWNVSWIGFFCFTTSLQNPQTVLDIWLRQKMFMYCHQLTPFCYWRFRQTIRKQMWVLTYVSISS